MNRRQIVLAMLPLIIALGGADNAGLRADTLLPPSSPTLVERIAEQLVTIGADVTITPSGDGIALADPTSRELLVTVTQGPTGGITIEGTLGYAAACSDTRARVSTHCRHYNDRASVGTMLVDERSGAIILRHRVTADALGEADIARLALQLSSIARAERRAVAAITTPM